MSEKNLVIWCVPCLILGCLTCLSPRALHLSYSLFLLRHKNTQHNRYNKSNSENTQYITHISTGYEPKELATVSRIEVYSGDPYHVFVVHEEVGEEDHRALITEEVEEFSETGTAGLRDIKIPETSYFQSQMHFDDSVESIADSDLEYGELQKMLTSPLFAQKASVKPDALVMQEREREVSAQYHSSRSKGQFEVSFIRR